MEPVAEKDENASTFDRTVAVMGLVWIPIVALFTYAAPVPAVWKWAMTVYGAYGFCECLGTLSDRPERWRPKLEVARVVAIGIAVVAFVYIAFTWRP
jgi:hypothetical protein